MKVFADKLIKITEGNAEEISRQWCKTVRKSNRTPSYHEIPEEECIAQAVNFYKNLSRVYFSKKPSRDLYEYFSKYAEERYDENILVIYNTDIAQEFLEEFERVQVQTERE